MLFKNPRISYSDMEVFCIVKIICLCTVDPVNNNIYYQLSDSSVTGWAGKYL